MTERNIKWCCYILSCSDNSFYCGITNDMAKRLEKHNKGKGAKYTRGRLPVRLVGIRTGLTKSQAAKLERKVKGTNKDQKIVLLKTFPIV